MIHEPCACTLTLGEVLWYIEDESLSLMTKMGVAAEVAVRGEPFAWHGPGKPRRTWVFNTDLEQHRSIRILQKESYVHPYCFPTILQVDASSCWEFVFLRFRDPPPKPREGESVYRDKIGMALRSCGLHLPPATVILSCKPERHGMDAF